MMITEKEAQKSVISLMTAMFHNDKEARETIYSDLDEDSLKRIIRWAIRQNINHFAALAIASGKDPIQAWSEFAMLVNLALEENEDD
jgi:hypothetical protein